MTTLWLILAGLTFLAICVPKCCKTVAISACDGCLNDEYYHGPVSMAVTGIAACADPDTGNECGDSPTVINGTYIFELGEFDRNKQEDLGTFDFDWAFGGGFCSPSSGCQDIDVRVTGSVLCNVDGYTARFDITFPGGSSHGFERWQKVFTPDVADAVCLLKSPIALERTRSGFRCFDPPQFGGCVPYGDSNSATVTLDKA